MTTSTRSRRMPGLLVVVAALSAVGELTGAGPLLLGGGDAHAVIGRPLTPMSYAGVARRTTRRAVYATGAAATSAAVVATTPVVPTASVVTALPGGCGQVSDSGSVYYQCGAARYQPYYHGSALVYRPL